MLRDDPRVPLPYRMLGDSAFKNKALQPHKLLVPRTKDQFSSNRRTRRQEQEAQQVIVRVRQAVEWGNRALQGSFARLRGRLPANKTLRRLILRVVVRLYNVRVRCVGLNQIRSVFLEPLQIFVDKRDRVAAFWGFPDDAREHAVD